MTLLNKLQTDFDTSGTLRSADLLSLQSQVLEAIARGAALADTLELLCRRVELLAPEVRCSVLILEGKNLRHGAAPSLPEVYTRAIDGAEIGPMAGSCGTAAYLGEAVQVDDIATDPRWNDYKNYALPHGLLACWSTPIIGREQSVLGTFALYYGEVRAPSNFHREAVKAATHLAAIAIERHHMDAVDKARILKLERNHTAMEALNNQLEERVRQRTADLDQRNTDLQRTLEELILAQNALIETRKQISLGRLVAGVAHELNTPVGNALLLTSSLNQRSKELKQSVDAHQLSRSALLEFMQEIEEGHFLLSTSLQDVARRIRSYRSIVVDQDSTQRSRFALADSISNSLTLLSSSLRESQCELKCQIPDKLELNSYPAQLQAVLDNILSNALLHGLKNRPHGQISIQAQMLNEREVEIRISDNGHGISSEHQAHVFDPFFTTQVSEGFTGLGLHVAYTLVHGVLGGQILLCSEPEAGTTLTLRLPLRAPDLALAQQPS